LVIDWTTTGAPPPTITPPTSTATDSRRGKGDAKYPAMTGGLLETAIFGLEVAESGHDVNGADRRGVPDARHAGAGNPLWSQGIVRGREPREGREYLRDLGRNAEEDWLADHFDATGVRPTLDLSEELQARPAHSASARMGTRVRQFLATRPNPASSTRQR
jgi:hypothetical protein